MNIKIIKNKENDYTLELQSGHFTGKLSSISESAINNLIISLEMAKADQEKMVRVWNPRSRRHEEVPESQVCNKILDL